MMKLLSQKTLQGGISFLSKTMLLAATFLFVGKSKGQTIVAQWTFEGVTTTNTGTTPVVSAGTTTADVGVQTAGSSFAAVHAGSATAWSNPAGNGSAKSLSSNTWAVGDYYQFSASTTDYSGISIAFDQTGSNTGPRDFKVQYSTNGTTFTDVSSGYSLPTGVTWSSSSTNATSTFTVSLTSVTALDNAATVYFRIVDNSTTAITGGTVATGGTDRVDNFKITALAILPLDILSFNAAKTTNGNLISWTTANEINVRSVVVERSADGRNFTQLQQLNAGNNNYQLLDASPIKGTNYYRLKIVDKDGSYKFSKIVAVINDGKGAVITGIYPTITQGQLTVDMSAQNAGAIQFVFTDLQGRNAIIKNVAAANGNSTISLDASSLAAGMYIIKVMQQNNLVGTYKIIKQ